MSIQMYGAHPENSNVDLCSLLHSMLSILTGKVAERIACKALSNSEYEERADE